MTTAGDATEGNSLTKEESAKLALAVERVDSARDEQTCVEALRVLLHFCDGQPTIIPALGSKHVRLIPVLVRLLGSGAKELEAVLELLEVMLHACRVNCKAVLRVRGSVAALTAALNTIVVRPTTAGGVLPKICTILRTLVRHRPALRGELMDAEAASVVAAVIATLGRMLDVDLQPILQLAAELAGDDPSIQDALRENGCLGELIALLSVELQMMLGTNPPPSDAAAAGRLTELCLCIGSLVAENEVSRHRILSGDILEMIFAAWGSATRGGADPLTVLLVKLISEPVDGVDEYDSGGGGSSGTNSADALWNSAAAQLVGDNGALDSGIAQSSLRLSFSAYHSFCLGVNQIRRFHYDDEVVAGALAAMTRQVSSVPQSGHLFAHVAGSIRMLVNSFNVVDEKVLANACILAHRLFLESDGTQLLFCREGGLEALYESLHDYDVTIRTLVLKLLTILASNYDLPTRLDMVQSGLLPRLVDILGGFLDPEQEDVDLAVAEAACGLLTHLVVFAPAADAVSTKLVAVGTEILEYSSEQLRRELDEAAAGGAPAGEGTPKATPVARTRSGGSGGQNALYVGTMKIVDEGPQFLEARLRAVCPQPPMAALVQGLCLIMANMAYQDRKVSRYY